MAIITLKSKGVEYSYYETLVEWKDNSRMVRTKIGKKKMDPEEFEKRCWIALDKHGKKLKQLWLDNQKKYHFENIPEFHDRMELLDIKYGYHVFRQELTPKDLKEFEQVLFIRYVYGTTALEGNTYSESETDKLLRSGIETASKSPTEATEIINFNEARNFVNRNKPSISEQFIKNIHAILMKGIKKPNGKYVKTGQYRTDLVILKNISFIPCDPEIVETKMKYTIEEYYSGIENSIHPVELACKFHQQFVEIHPFEDGNGRTGREVLNYMLRMSGYPQIYIPPSDHNLYFYALAEGNKSNYTPLIDFVIHRLYQTHMYFLTKTDGLKEGEEYKKYYEATEGKESYQKYKQLRDNFASKESLT